MKVIPVELDTVCNLPSPPLGEDAVYAFGEFERQAVHAVINNASQQQITLERNISQLQTLLQEQIGERFKRQQFIASQQNLLCQVNSLPVEVLTEIFFLHAHSWTINPHIELDKIWLGPFHLSHVCRLWRQLAIKKAALWTFIFLSRGVGESLLLSPQNLDMWLRRSGDHPLDVVVHVDHYVTRLQTQSSLSKLWLSILWPTFSRWRTLALHQIYGEPNIFPLPIEPSTSILESLFMEGIDADPLSWTPFLTENLRRLHANSYDGALRVLLSSTTLVRLVEMQLEDPSLVWSDLLYILNTQPALEVLIIHNSDLSADSMVHVTHHMLHTLILHCNTMGGSGDPCPIFDGLVLPNLIRCAISRPPESFNSALQQCLSASLKLETLLFTQDMSGLSFHTNVLLPHPLVNLAVKVPPFDFPSSHSFTSAVTYDTGDVVQYITMVLSFLEQPVLTKTLQSFQIFTQFNFGAGELYGLCLLCDTVREILDRDLDTSIGSLRVVVHVVADGMSMPTLQEIMSDFEPLKTMQHSWGELKSGSEWSNLSSLSGPECLIYFS
ncbi:hypothetical protein DL96DRAFT_1710421 [Flagelloscypha sp. PMI_526]|nr:hypothetical protein DL96DRAFT_1710421 [Flagelloscypha sp. PMI_526]